MIISNSTIKNFLNFAGKRLHAPEQKVILTATALGIQPVIDMKNKNVDEKTRKISTARDITKLIAGAVTGISIRYLGIAVAKKLTSYEPIYDATKRFMTGVKANCGIFMPKKFIGKKAMEKTLVKNFDSSLNSYIKAMGTVLATVTMFYTNFSCDAKWTTKYTPLTYKCFFNEDMNADETKNTKKSNESEVKKS